MMAFKGVRISCVALLKSRSYSPPSPLSSAARLSLVYVALERGGNGAYSRLVQTNGDVATKLSAAAHMPADSLLAAWRSDLMISRGGPVRLSFGSGLFAVGWILFFAMLASRSSRWR